MCPGCAKSQRQYLRGCVSSHGIALRTQTNHRSDSPSALPTDLGHFASRNSLRGAWSSCEPAGKAETNHENDQGTTQPGLSRRAAEQSAGSFVKTGDFRPCDLRPGQRYRLRERDRSYDPFYIRAYAAKSAWFQEGN